MSMNCKIKYIKKTRVSIDAWDLHFEKPEDFNYQSGQFIEVNIPQQHPDDRGQKRWFTLSSSPTENSIDITTRKLLKHSSFKDYLFRLKRNDEISINGPSGSFILPDNSQKLVWIAGGIGITPFRSQIKYLTDSKIFDYSITLFHGNKSLEDNICRDLMTNYHHKNPNFKYIEVLSENIPKHWTGESGYIDKKIIQKYVDDLQSRHYYISGPEPMVDAVKIKLSSIAIDDNHIHQDWFPGYTDMF